MSSKIALDWLIETIIFGESTEFMTHKLLQIVAFVCALTFAGGCALDEETPNVRLLRKPSGLVDRPVVNLPVSLRQKNWTSQNGEGSCVIASTVSMTRWQHQYELAQWLRRTQSGGQTASSIQRILTQAQVPFTCTLNADPNFLEWATRTRRGAIIWYFPQHCVTFCGFGTDNGGRQVAWILDNNRTDKFIPIPKADFLRKWGDYGGFALTTLYEPSPPLPWPAIEVLE